MDWFPILLILISISLSAAAADADADAVSLPAPAKSSLNPFTEKAALLRYWNRKIPNSSPYPAFLVSKLTPLSISNAAKFSTLAASDPFKLSSTLPAFCSAAALLCTAELNPSLASHPGDSDFSCYDNSSFTYYGTEAGGRVSAFKSYHNSSSAQIHTESRHPGLKQWVEPGKFFRESSLKEGMVMPMPDINDRNPPRSFLPRSIAGNIPLTASAVAQIFKFPPGTTMEKAVASTVADCERSPSRGETKRCATSAEDMIDFAVSVLGGDVEVRSTANTNGSQGNILIGEVKGLNGGNVTESVSCHQSLFPYLVYYCHSVPRVRLYEAEILAVDSGEKINYGIAICHTDTSDWSPTHRAFAALGPGPGKIEVCHWIFEGDMTWTVRDRV